MNRLFKNFRLTGIDLAPLGVEFRENNTPYFCTPKGATIFGWAGVDGIHFCFIHGFGGIVFSVNPTESAPNFVHPVARNFTDFLRLLFVCGDSAAIEQAWTMSEDEFADFLRDNPPGSEQREVLHELSLKIRLAPIPNPWTYIRWVQSSFDYSKIRYTDEYYELGLRSLTRPEWKVYFEGDFWSHSGHDHVGHEIPLGREFIWAEHRWFVPAVYLCGRGFVADFCMRVEPENIREFMRKWNPADNSHGEYTAEQRAQIDFENPLLLNFNPRLHYNGRILQASHGFSTAYIPFDSPEDYYDRLEAKWVVEHYGLDESYGWVIYRYAFPLVSGRRSDINMLTLTFEQQPDRIPGPHFKIHQPGDSFSFTHPFSGTDYILTAQAIERSTVPQDTFGSKQFFYPTNLVTMSYTLFPDSDGSISVFDCDEGDRPLNIVPPEPMSPTAVSSAAVIGVIGGADGPTAIAFTAPASGQNPRLRAACSSLHFDPVEGDVEWRIEFAVKRFDDASFSLI